MKLTLQIIISVIILAVGSVSCSHDHKRSERLAEADALVESGHYAEALAILDSIDEQACSISDRARFHFIKAVSLDEYTHINEAILLLRQSIMEATACSDDSIAHKAHIYLAYINNISGNHTLAIEHGISALEIARKHKDPRWEGAAFLQLSGSYHAKGMSDSSRYYLSSLVPLLDHQNRKDLPDMLNNIAVGFLEDNDLQQARHYLARSLRLQSNEHTYYLMAIAYQREGRQDSAEMMWRKALTSKDPFMKARISQAYAEWLKEGGNFEAAAAVMSNARMIRDSLERKGLGEMAMAAHTDSERREAEQHHNRLTLLYLIISGLLLIAVAALWICLRWKSRRAKRLSLSASMLSSQMEDMEGRMDELRAEIDVLHDQCERHDRDARQLEKMVNEKSRQLRLLEQKHACKEREMKVLSVQMQKMESHIEEVKTIGAAKHAQLLAGGKATQWSKNDMVLFVEYYSLIHPDFAVMMHDRYASLSPTLSTIVILTDMGFDSQQIKETLGMSDGALRTARSRINSSRI